MSRFRRTQIYPDEPVINDEDVARSPESHVSEDHESFIGDVVERNNSCINRDYEGDYLYVPSRPHLIKILDKQDPETDMYQINSLGSCSMNRSDNFLAIIIPTEHDLLMASTRKNKIAKVLIEAIMNLPDYELDVFLE
ncbi:hypothetical protein Leryth_027359 [Lithospermum erythrorhizon]|nr:hypothetical protein Leryth_027359 [Lithospermum erythrorhizon]